MTRPYVRLNPKNAESVRQKIQIVKLTKRLQKHALGEVEMTSTQIDAAKFLINKRMPNPPDTTKHEHSGSLSVQWPLSRSPLDQ
jgi:hypothetical protein